ncbi:MAG: hypothetical protein V5A34_05715 [Halapricum sp.]
MNTPTRRLLVLYVVAGIVLVSAATGGYYVTGLFSDGESVLIQFSVSSVGNTALTEVGNTAVAPSPINSSASADGPADPVGPQPTDVRPTSVQAGVGQAPRLPVLRS